MTKKPTLEVVGDPLDPDNPEHVRDAALAIYEARLNSPSGGGKGATKRIIEQEGKAKLRANAVTYDTFARAVLTAFDVRRRR